jgi:hypothetical protein
MRHRASGCLGGGLFCGGYFCCRPTPGQKTYAVSLGMFFVYRSRRDITGVPRAVSAAVTAEDERDRSLQHKQPRVELVRVSVTMHMGFDFALAEFIALAPKVGFKPGSIHRHLPFSMRDDEAPRRTMRQLTRGVE